MTRPAWHGVRVGDEVRFTPRGRWYVVAGLPRSAGVRAENRVVELRRRGMGTQAQWLTGIVERRRP